MRNKLLVIGSVLLMMVLCLAGNESLKHENDRYHQHLAQANAPLPTDTSHIDASTYGSRVISQEGFVSHLPVITIDTGGQTVPGSSVSDYSRIRSTMQFFSSDNSGLETNTLDREPEVESLADIRYRGNTSRYFDKKGYSIHLVKENDKENHKALFGMRPHDEWALHGPFMDKTMVRNYLMYNLSGQIMDWAPNVRFCELFVNGAYQGIYLLVEQIAVSEERLNLHRSVPSDPFTSYLVEIVSTSRAVPGDPALLNNFTHYSEIMPTTVRSEVSYPAAKNITPVQLNYIQNDISKFERMLYSYDYDDPNLGYRDQINMRSFVDYVVINEFSLNYDAGNVSTFIFKDAKGDFDICVWDFNNTFDNYAREIDLQDFYFRNRIWFDMFLKDEEFVQRVVSRYKELRTTWLNDDYLLDYIDGAIAYLGPAIERNFTVWGDSFLLENSLQLPAERNTASFAIAVEQLKTTMLERGAFLDENIETLFQFCHSSKTKAYNP